MTDKQPDPLRVAAELDCHNASLDRQAAKAIRTQHAEIERLNAAIKWEQNRAERIGTHGQGCEKWGSAHYECLLRSVERKDALLRQALEAIESHKDTRWECNSDHPKLQAAMVAIKEELQ